MLGWNATQAKEWGRWHAYLGWCCHFLLKKSVITESKWFRRAPSWFAVTSIKDSIPLLSLGRLFSFITYLSKASSLSSIHLKFRLQSNQDSTSSASIFTFKVQSTKIIPRKREYPPRTHESTSFQYASSLTSFFQQYSWCFSPKFLRTGTVERENSTFNSKKRCKQITPRFQLIFLERRTTHISSIHTWTSSLWCTQVGNLRLRKTGSSWFSVPIDWATFKHILPQSASNSHTHEFGVNRVFFKTWFASPSTHLLS